MVARNRARYLAPIALVAALAGTYLVVHASLTGKHQAHAHGSRLQNASRRRLSRTKFYTVQQGDSLTSIAAKTGVRLTTLEELNPSIDPNSLQTGQRLRLRR